MAGIGLSPHMAGQLLAKPGAGAVPVTIGDMTSTRVPGAFPLVYLVAPLPDCSAGAGRRHQRTVMAAIALRLSRDPTERVHLDGLAEGGGFRSPP